MQKIYYKSIFHQARFGFAHHEIITDGGGKPIDYRYIEVNEQYEKLTGLKASNIIGKSAGAVYRGVENSDFDRVPCMVK